MAVCAGAGSVPGLGTGGARGQGTRAQVRGALRGQGHANRVRQHGHAGQHPYARVCPLRVSVVCPWGNTGRGRQCVPCMPTGGTGPSGGHTARTSTGTGRSVGKRGAQAPPTTARGLQCMVTIVSGAATTGRGSTGVQHAARLGNRGCASTPANFGGRHAVHSGTGVLSGHCRRRTGAGTGQGNPPVQAPG